MMSFKSSPYIYEEKLYSNYTSMLTSLDIINLYAKENTKNTKKKLNLLRVFTR